MHLVMLLRHREMLPLRHRPSRDTSEASRDAPEGTMKHIAMPLKHPAMHAIASRDAPEASCDGDHR
eukprot:2337023-Prymnesium_polylepis.1